MSESEVVYYAMGAGLGHLTRAKKVIAALGINTPVNIVTNARFVAEDSTDKYLLQNEALLNIQDTLQPYKILRVPPYFFDNSQQSLAWLKKTFDKTITTEFIVDCFPSGIKGELAGLSSIFPHTKFTHIARLLKWQEYVPLLKTHNHYSDCYYIEPLFDEHERYLKQHADNLLPLQLLPLQPLSSQPLSLHLPPTQIQASTQVECTLNSPVPVPAPVTVPESLPDRYCAIVHTGSEQEIDALIQYSLQRLAIKNRSLPVIVITPEPSPCVVKYTEMLTQHIIPLNVYPALPVLLRAEVVVSGAGFNTLNELKGRCCEHWILPFERRFDDQFERAARYRSS